ncbi:MAG: hypothetical protein DID90_2727552947 [Candidatus Nitrotoga sp. LAW]|nr:MAG: hypothetical protein DID90_2727552947 [Candidatus Nitrotoga sp. LAW]
MGTGNRNNNELTIISTGTIVNSRISGFIFKLGRSSLMALSISLIQPQTRQDFNLPELQQ